MHSINIVLVSLAAFQVVVGQDLYVPGVNQLPLEDRPLNQQKVYAVAAYTRVNWFNAQQICSYRQMTLASINSEAEKKGLMQFLQMNGLENAMFWLSGTNLGGQNWVWLSNGRPISYTQWSPGEPNNAGNNEHCLVVRTDGLWNDVDCASEQFFICENRCALDSYNVPLFKKK